MTKSVADNLQVIGTFVSASPPTRHKRKSYKDPCEEGCVACAYERMRQQALDAFIACRQQLTDSRGIELPES